MTATYFRHFTCSRCGERRSDQSKEACIDCRVILCSESSVPDHNRKITEWEILPDGTRRRYLMAC